MSIEMWIVILQAAVLASVSANIAAIVVSGRGQSRRQSELLDNDKRIFERLRKLEGERRVESEK